MTQSRNEPFIGRLDPTSGEALYLQLAHAIEESLKTGRLHVGDRLPAERELALELGVSRTTVTGAYQELQARGILRGHVGRGTIVVGSPPDARHAALPWAQRIAPVTIQGLQVAYDNTSSLKDLTRTRDIAQSVTENLYRTRRVLEG